MEPITMDFLTHVISTGLIAAFVAFGLNHYKDKSKKKSDLLSLLKSYRAEIVTVWNQHKSSLKVTDFNELNLPKGFLSIYPVTYDYFTVYHYNADRIGTINNDELRSNIIRAYSRAKGLVDTFRLNNELVNKVDDLYYQFRLTGNPEFQKIMNAELERVAEYGKIILQRNIELDELIKELTSELDKEITRLSCTCWI